MCMMALCVVIIVTLMAGHSWQLYYVISAIIWLSAVTPYNLDVCHSHVSLQVLLGFICIKAFNSNHFHCVSA